MLKLRRKEQESIIIDGCIEVVILGIQADRNSKAVSIGIVAPKNISVHRKEIQDAIDREKTEGLQALTA